MVEISHDAAGSVVVRHRLAVADAPAAHDRVRREVARRGAAAGEHLVVPYAVVVEDGSLVLVRRHVPGDALATYVTTHGPLDDGRLVTLAVPLAQALAGLHDLGRAHGGVCADAVVIAEDGRPVLVDTAVEHATPSGRVPEAAPQDDVRDLALLCRSVLGATPSAALLDVLDAAMSDDPDERPTAGDVAVALFRAVRPAPLLGGGAWSAVTTRPVVEPGRSTPTPAPSAHRRRRNRRARHHRLGLRHVILVAALVALGVAVALTWSRDGRPTARVTFPDASPGPSGSTPTSTTVADNVTRRAAPTDWAGVLRSLDASRALAFSDPARAALSAVDAAGSPARRRDHATLRSLADGGLHATGLHWTLRSVRVLDHKGDRVVLDVRDTRAAYVVADAHGRQLEQHDARAVTRWRVTLQRQGSGWRVYDVAERSSSARSAVSKDG